jgi:hypothetical protein
MRSSPFPAQQSISFLPGPRRRSRVAYGQRRHSAAGTGHRGGCPGPVVSKAAGRTGREEAAGRRRSIRASRSVRRSCGPIETGRRSSGAEMDGGSSPRLRGELRLPRVRVRRAIGPADVHHGETLDGPNEGPLAPVTPPHAAVIGGTVRIEPVGRGDPPQDDLIDRARGIVEGAPIVHSVENGGTTGNLRRRGPTR